VLPSMTRTNANFKDFPGLHDVDAAPREDAHMEKGIAGPIR
jgi:hypothetical protein